MTPREQVIIILFAIVIGGMATLWLLDWASEQITLYRNRERTWREIEIRSSRERHPSNQVSVFDQDAQ